MGPISYFANLFEFFDTKTQWQSISPCEPAWNDFIYPWFFFFFYSSSYCCQASFCHLSVIWKTPAAVRSSSSHRHAWTDIYCTRAEALSSSGIQVESQIYYPFPGGVCFKMEMNLGVQDVQHINNTCLPLTTAIKQFFL